MTPFFNIRRTAGLLCLAFIFSFARTQAAEGELRVNLSERKEVARIQYGFHYEEIGMMGEGGLHAELVRNRAFEEANMPPGLKVRDGRYVGIPGNQPTGRKKPYQQEELVGWQRADDGDFTMARTHKHPLNPRNPHSLKIDAKGEGAFENTGFFGMNIVEGEIYNLSLFVRSDGFEGSLKVYLCDANGQEISKAYDVPLTGDWQSHKHAFTATNADAKGRLRFQFDGSGSLQLDVVSLYPDNTWDEGRSVFRRDIMENLRDYNPDFVRFPGGCIVHGVNVETNYYWKDTIGPMHERPGAWSKWAPHYRTDGIGFHEFLELCEYLDANAIFVAPTGMICTGWVHEKEHEDYPWHHEHPEVDVDAFVQDAIDAIEYAIGPVTSKWGARRAANGHPEPFPLKYLEIGNEDFGPTYWERYDRFHRAIKARYPEIKTIANSVIGRKLQDKRADIPKFRQPKDIEIFDEHYYNNLDWVYAAKNKFDAYERPSPDLFIGELGIDGPYPRNILGEGIIHLYLEHNADLNPLSADRPLMRNWDFAGRKASETVMLLHTSDQSIKTFNFHLSKLFRDHKIDAVFPSNWHPKDGDSEVGINTVFSSAGFDFKKQDLVLKLINLTSRDRKITMQLGNIDTNAKAEMIVLTAGPKQFNTPDSPDSIKPETRLTEVATQGELSLSPRSLTIIRIPKAELANAIE